MPDQPDGPKITVGYSVQNEGNIIGVHFELPLVTQVIGFPISIAEMLAKEFGPNMQKALKQAERTRSGLTIAPADTLKTLKRKN